MLLITDLNEIPELSKPCGLTIGSFDGVHLGHQAILKSLRAQLPPDAVIAVFTFSNHPSHLFTPDRPAPLICPPLQKVKHLAEYGAGIVFLIPFSEDFAKQSFRDFLQHLKNKLKFSHLALGTGAAFGHRKEGDETNVRKLGSTLGFEVNYLPKTMVGGALVSSGRIRSLIAQGAFQDVQECLGRPYSLMGHLRKNTFEHFSLPGICLPPEGVYAVRIKANGSVHLGRAQVLPQEQLIRLDPLKTDAPIHDKDVEVIF